jgi:hypothetical protein
MSHDSVGMAKPSNSKSGSEIIPDTCAECGGVSEDYERLTITKYGNSDAYSSVNINFNQLECNNSGDAP